MAADPIWTQAEPLAFAPPGSHEMAVAAAGDVVHVVWVVAKTLYYARLEQGKWQAPVKVAGGEEPSLAAAADGTLYCAYTNQFLGNRDIYLSIWTDGKWSLSQVVSHTAGQSSDSAICVGPDGVVHLAWADDTSGYSVIYYGKRQANAWTYAPVPNGKGSRPSIAANANVIYVAWQDRVANSEEAPFEVLATAKRGEEWSMPVVVSDTPIVHSVLPRIATNPADRCHMVWQEEREGLHVVRHADLWPNGWAAPVDVSEPAADARVGAILPNRFGHFQVVWSEGRMLKHRVRPGEPQAAWWEPEVACEDCPCLSGLAATLSAGGDLHVLLNRWTSESEQELLYLKRRAIERKKVLMPLVGY